ncbi:hypothetical protein SELMODRAFT_425549 [Selaginella moellendorffii]|uniref:Uncharacterized protein n=1 Tax=Selaginella moellendorffii TaxID=88036 RepID=D8STG7_SELML|nr:hypothetical protein SELMODRAFT_425549 [Selaginella moellendorffii]
MGVTIRIERLLQGLQKSMHSHEKEAEASENSFAREDYKCHAQVVLDNFSMHPVQPGINDVLEETTRSHLTGGISERGSPQSSVPLTSADDMDSDGTRLFQDEITKLVKQLGESRARVATLEIQFELLSEEKNRENSEHEYHLKQYEDQIQQLEKQAGIEVAELKQRQSIIECEMPALEEQLKSLKNIICDLNLTETQHISLRFKAQEYLIRELKLKEDLVIQLELENEQQRQKIKELKRSKHELYERIIQDTQESTAVQEQRFQNELRRIQDQAQCDVKTVQKETVEMASRESQALREVRDVVLAQLQKSQTAVQELQAAYEELNLKHNAIQRDMSIKEMDVLNDAKLKAFMFDRLQSLHEETSVNLQRSKIENEALTEKVKVLTDRYYNLELELKTMEEKASVKVHKIPDESSPTIVDTQVFTRERVLIQKLAAAVNVIVQRQLQKMENKCLRLQTTLEAAQQENADNKLMVEENPPEEEKSPFVIRQARIQKRRVTNVLDKMKQDLLKLIAARGNIESLQNILAEKGSKVKDDVMRRFNNLKDLELCSKS